MSTTNIEALADILALPMTDGNLTTRASADTAMVVARHLDKHGVRAPDTPPVDAVFTIGKFEGSHTTKKADK